MKDIIILLMASFLVSFYFFILIKVEMDLFIF